VYRTLLVIGGVLMMAAWQRPAAASRDAAIYGHVSHLGWVVKDLDAVTRAWRTFGVTSIQDATVLDIPMTQQGKQSIVKVRRATAQLGSQAIHWIQPLGGPDVFTSFLASHGEGVHHIAYDVPTGERFDEEVRSLAAAGIDVAQEGTFATPAGAARFAYLDTATGGITVELEHNPAIASGSPPPAPPNDDPFNRITQLAFIVRDIQAVSAYWARVGLGGISSTATCRSIVSIAASPVGSRCSSALLEAATCRSSGSSRWLVRASTRSTSPRTTRDSTTSGSTSATSTPRSRDSDSAG
jgi:Glyoxalase/Bleomycin resistance protein/Dioxygenase superfamily